MFQNWNQEPHQSCRQSEMSSEFGSICFFCFCFFKRVDKLGAFKKTKIELTELFLGALDKYVEVLCYFRELFERLVAFGSFLRCLCPILKIAQKFCAIFCAIF